MRVKAGTTEVRRMETYQTYAASHIEWRKESTDV